MMYQHKFVAVIKVGGKILREQGDTVTIPFGAEYSIMLKNKETRKASVGIEIDGQDVLSGNHLVVPANGEIEVERFLENLCTGNKFKFIQKTKKIMDHRGDKIDDGLIRIDFRFEKPQPEWNTIYHRHVDFYPWRTYWHPWDYYYYHTLPVGFTPTPFLGSALNANNVVSGLTHQSQCFSEGAKGHSDMSVNYCASVGPVDKGDSKIEAFNPIPNVDEGITVKGDISHQNFNPTWVGELEENSYSLIFKLRGTKSNGTFVTKPLKVKDKLECTTCGTKNRSTVKFCGDCGTSLI
jgi:hypothetical protein